MVPKIPSCHYMLLMLPSRLKFSIKQFHVFFTCKITTATGWQTNWSKLLLLLLLLLLNAYKILLEKCKMHRLVYVELMCRPSHVFNIYKLMYATVVLWQRPRYVHGSHPSTESKFYKEHSETRKTLMLWGHTDQLAMAIWCLLQQPIA